MRSRCWSIARLFVLAISFGLYGAAVMAATLGIAWDRSFSSGEESGGFHLLSARRLVDGSLIAVVSEDIGATAVRFDAEGAVLSSSTLSASGQGFSAVTDPFGSVVLFTRGFVNAGYDLVVMKYDGLTGKKVWPAPARIHALPFQGFPSAAIGSSGDVFVTAGVLRQGVGTIGWATLCYDGRTGRILWGPALYGDSAGPVDLAIDPAGDVVVAGFAAASDRSLWAAIKYRGATGEQVWGPLLIGAVSTAPPPTVCPGECYSPPTAAKPAFDRKGNVFLTVSSFTAPYGQEWLTAKYDGATGNLIWGPVSNKTGTEVDFDVPSAIGVNGNGDVVVGGSVLPSPYSNNSAVNKLVKYSGATGARIWGPAPVSSTISSLVFDGGGQVFVMGTSSSGYPYRTMCSTSSFDGRSGRKRWEENLGSAGSDFSYSPTLVVVGSDGNVTSVAVAIVGMGADQHGEVQTINYANATGSIVWGPVATRSRSAGTYPLALLVDRSGDTVLFTASREPGSILKYSRDGRDLWGPVRVPDARSPTGLPAHAAMDFRGDVILAGTSLSKYSGASGLLLWGPVLGEDHLESKAVTTDGVGDVLLTGLSRGRWVTWKYRGGTGDLVWSTAYDQPVNTATPSDIAVDRQGDVVVTGSWARRGDDSVWVTWKYAGATGDPLWGPSLSGEVPAGTGAPTRLVIDGSGDVIVTGISDSYRGTFWQVLKYSGTTGMALWGPVGLPVSNVGPEGLVLDQVGDIFLVGSRVEDPRAQNPITVWSTAKFGGSTGAMVWGPKDFPAPVGSRNAVITLDASGNASVAGTVSIGTNNQWVLVRYDSSTGNVVFGPETYDNGGIEQVSQIKIVGSDVLLEGNAEALARTVRYGTALSIATLQNDLTPAPGLCGGLFLRSLAASNGSPPMVWEISAGRIPPGVELDPFSGRLSGILSESGSFSFNIRVRDATGAIAERHFTIDVLDGEPYLMIEVDPEDKCLPGQYTLSVPGTYASYHWLPGGETTPEITVCPFQPTIYAVTVTEVNGCERRGSIELQPFKIELVPREPLVPPGRKRPAPPVRPLTAELSGELP